MQSPTSSRRTKRSSVISILAEQLQNVTKAKVSGSRALCEKLRCSGSSELVGIVLTALKGEAEVNMLRFAQTDELNGLWETLIVKAGFVTQNEMWSPRDAIGYILGTKMSIRVSELAAFMTEAALEGSWEENTMQNNEEMVKRGREALDKMK
jgi:hypothetical protein